METVMHMRGEAIPAEIRKRDMKLSDHNISRDKYNELKYFCLQYWQKKQEIGRNYGIDGFNPVSYTHLTLPTTVTV